MLAPLDRLGRVGLGHASLSKAPAAADALQANAAGDWIGAAIYNDWSSRYDNAGWTLYNAAGC